MIQWKMERVKQNLESFQGIKKNDFIRLNLIFVFFFIHVQYSFAGFLVEQFG